MSASDLRAEIKRYIRHAGKFATPHAVLEGLRNRWQYRLEAPLDAQSYELQMADLLEDMVGTGELRANERGYQVPATKYPKPRGWISFGWTTSALLEGYKTVTRRSWKESHASTFHQGDVVQAYNKLPMVGGRSVALIRLTHTPFRQRSDRVPDIDWYNEGFSWLTTQRKKDHTGKTPQEIWDDWKENPQELWVLRFELLEIL